MVGNGPAPIAERQLPPIAPLAVGSIVLVVIGGVYIASYVPKSVPLGPAIGLLAGAGLLLLANVVTLARVPRFAWDRFFQIFGFTLLAYLVIAGMIGYVFVADGTPGNVLVVLILMLAIFAVDIPLLLAFSVARYQDVA